MDITEGLSLKIRQAIDKSIENNSKETFLVYKSFVRRVLQISVRNKSLKHFQEFIFFPALFYAVSFDKMKQNQMLYNLHKICSEQAAIHLKEIIWFDVGLTFKHEEGLKAKKEINPFFYWGFYSFSQLLFFTIKNSDISQFTFALNEYGQISNSEGSLNYQLKYKIQNLKQKNANDTHTEEIKKLEETYTVHEAFNTYKRHVLKGLKYWIFYLYSKKKISVQVLKVFIEKIEEVREETQFPLEDILFFRSSESNTYMGWTAWDFMERPHMIVYSPPSPLNWTTFGFIVEQIRRNGLYINLNDFDNRQIRDAHFLFEEIKGYRKYFEHNFESWKVILKVQTKEELSTRYDNLLQSIGVLKHQSITNIETSIADTELSQDKINDFKETIGKVWERAANIRKLFKKYDNRQLILDNNIKLRIIGQTTFFEKAKMMFIDGDKYQEIYGIGDMGGVIGRWEDDEFFNTITKDEFNRVRGASALETLDTAIAELKNKNVIPNLILIAPEYSYKDAKFLESDRFVPKTEMSMEESGYSFLGTFDDIPVYTSFSALLNNKIVVCDFNSAFKMVYKSDENWYNNEFKVEVLKISDEEANARLRENPTKWKNEDDGIIRSENDALTLIKTSVIINTWTVLEFKILSKEAYVIGNIKGSE